MGRTAVEGIIGACIVAVISVLAGQVFKQAEMAAASLEAQKRQTQATLEIRDTVKTMFSLVRQNTEALADARSELSRQSADIDALRRDVDRLEAQR